jgi:hypothetical protein
MTGPRTVRSFVSSSPEYHRAFQFLGGRLDLSELCPTANAEDGEFEARLETVPAHVRAPDLGTTCEIAEFFLNDLPMPSPPGWRDLEQYVDEHFKQAEGGYQLSCHQDFLRVSRSVDRHHRQ